MSFCFYLVFSCLTSCKKLVNFKHFFKELALHFISLFFVSQFYLCSDIYFFVHELFGVFSWIVQESIEMHFSYFLLLRQSCIATNFLLINAFALSQIQLSWFSILMYQERFWGVFCLLESLIYCLFTNMLINLQLFVLFLFYFLDS